MTALAPHSSDKWTYPIAGSVATVAVWYLVTEILGLFHSAVLPSPVQVLETYFGAEELILSSLYITLFAALIGFVLAVSLGVALAVIMVYDDRLYAALYPILVGGNSVPRIAMAPIIIFYVDIELTAKYIIAAWVAFFPMFVNTIEGLGDIDEDFDDLLATFEATTWQELRIVRIPNALPFIFDGLKLAAVLAIIGAVVTEFIIGSSGMGYLVMTAMQTVNMDLAFAVVLITGFISTALFFGLFAVQDRLVHWKETSFLPQ